LQKDNIARIDAIKTLKTKEGADATASLEANSKLSKKI
jgi:hypothetical protein